MNHSTSTFVFLSVLWLLGGWALGVQTAVQAESAARPVESAPQAADSLLLDQYPNAYQAYALRKLRSDYTGPAIRVRRTSDSAEKDVGFTQDGTLDTSALTSFVGSADGKIVKWYNQVQGGANLSAPIQSSPPPKIVKSGNVVTDANGTPMIHFEKGARMWTNLNTTFQTDDSAFIFAADPADDLSWQPGRVLMRFDYGDAGVRQADATHIKLSNDFGDLNNEGGEIAFSDTFVGGFSNALNQRSVYTNNARAEEITDGTNVSETKDIAQVGNQKTGAEGFKGKVGEFLVYPHLTESEYQDLYDNLNQHWQVGPTDYHRDALLPQQRSYQVDLYNYLETVTESDVTVPTGKTFETDLSGLTNDEKADLWLKVKGASVNKPTMGEPGWYVLDNGNGRGIEATGEVRLMFEPASGPGNPPRSWENEPAYLYQVDIPDGNGGQGNPYYKMPDLGRRAMVTAIVDMMMFDDAKKSGSAGWFDMIGKAFLGMAEAYRYAGEVLPSDARGAFETGMERILDHQIQRGPRAVNTNMDMFMLQGAADFYMATDDPTRKQKCVEVVKRALFGYTDGALETNHKVFKAGGGKDGGVFSSAGFIMEGDQPEIFYGGESKLHLMGAYMAVYDRETDTVPSDWQFLEEVLRRTQAWRTYQWFHNPDPDYFARGSGSGFTSRTSAPVPAGQAAHPWKLAAWADVFDEAKATLRSPYKGKRQLPQMYKIENQVSNKINGLTSSFSQYDTTQADSWSGWSPWTKPTPYLPPEGWYSRLNSLLENDDPLTYPPSARDGVTFNKTFGGPPLGKSWWSYKQADGTGTEWGFFAEAMPSQGNYAGYYGGKIETFWTDEVGYVLVNRHYKSGNPSWGAMDYWAAQHVWGKDENGDLFTTAWLRGWDLNRSVTFNTNGSPPSITVNNPFNEPNYPSINGEQKDAVLQGDVDVENKIEALSDGARITHTLTSDQSDEVTALWATIPFHIGVENAEQSMQDASLTYWDGAAWQPLPDDNNSDGTPETVSTTALRHSRPVGGTTSHAYVSFASQQTVRKSTQQFKDTYQTSTMVRPVHIDLHGDPGTTKTLPASKSVTYTIQTTDPTSEESTSTSQEIPLQEGWNIASTSISPAVPDMDSVFSGLQSEIVVVENEAGERYRPAENVDEIGQWNSEEAYRIYAKSNVTLSIEGDSLGSSSTTLEEGWNLVPYFSSSPLSIEEAVSSVTEDLVMVKDETGRVYLPEKGIEVLEQMEPGEGYRVYVRQSTTLTYPDGNN